VAVLGASAPGTVIVTTSYAPTVNVALSEIVGPFVTLTSTDQEMISGMATFPFLDRLFR
jgi:hypothetical protein